MSLQIPKLYCIIIILLITKVWTTTVDEAFQFAISCLKYDIIEYNNEGLFSDINNNFENLISSDFDIIEDRLKVIECKLTNELYNINTLNRKDKQKIRSLDILDSHEFTKYLKNLEIINKNKQFSDYICPIRCNEIIKEVLGYEKDEDKRDNLFLERVCEDEIFSIRNCVIYFENNITLENMNIKRSDSLDICKKIAKNLKRKSLNIEEISNFVALDLAIQEYTGSSLHLILKIDPEDVYFSRPVQYFIESIKRVNSNSIFNNKDVSENSNDLNLNFVYEEYYKFSFYECITAIEILSKLYLFFVIDATSVCALFFDYKGISILESENIYSNIQNTPLFYEGVLSLKQLIKVYLGDLAPNLDEEFNRKFLDGARFDIGKCLDALVMLPDDELLNKPYVIDLSTASSRCFTIYRKIHSEENSLLKTHNILFIAISINWLIISVKKERIINTISDKEIYSVENMDNIIFSLIMSMHEGWNISECFRHMNILQRISRFTSRKTTIKILNNNNISLERHIFPNSIKSEITAFICSKDSLISQLLSKLLPIRDFLQLGQPTQIPITEASYLTNAGSSGSIVHLKSLDMKNIFDSTLDSFYAVDVPRGYLSNAVSFSIVGLKTFLRNTLSFLSYDTILERYNKIYSKSSFTQSLSDVITIILMGNNLKLLQDTTNQINYIDKFICGGYNGNIRLDIIKSEIIPVLEQSGLDYIKEITTSYKMFDFGNCINQIIIYNWLSRSFSLLKSDPIIQCAIIGIYLARNIDYIMEEIRLYILSHTFLEILKYDIPKSCLKISFRDTPSLHLVEQEQTLEDSFIHCIKNYFLSINIKKVILPKLGSLENIANDFAKSVLQYVDNPITKHPSSHYGNILLDILNIHPIIGPKKSFEIMSSLRPFNGFDYKELVSKLILHGIPVDESNLLGALVGFQVGKDKIQLTNEFLNWVQDEAGVYLPNLDDRSKKITLVYLLANNKLKDKTQCSKEIREIYQNIIPDEKIKFLCDSWDKYLDYSPTEESVELYKDWLNNKFGSGINRYPGSENITFFDNLTKNFKIELKRYEDEDKLLSLEIPQSDLPISYIFPKIYTSELMDTSKEKIHGFQLESKEIILFDSLNKATTFESLNISSGNEITVMFETLLPNYMQLCIEWTDINGLGQGKSTIKIPQNAGPQFLICSIQNLPELSERFVKGITLPNGAYFVRKIEDCTLKSVSILDESLELFSLGVRSDDTIICSTVLNNESFLKLKIQWTIPSIISIVPKPRYQNLINIKEDYVTISRNVLFKDFIDEALSKVMKSVIVQQIHEYEDNPQEETKLNISSIEILENFSNIDNRELSPKSKIIFVNKDYYRSPLHEFNIQADSIVKLNLNVTPSSSFTIVTDYLDIQYTIRLSSLPIVKYSNKVPLITMGLYESIKLILGEIENFEVLIKSESFKSYIEYQIYSDNEYKEIMNIKVFDPVKELLENSLIFVKVKNIPKLTLIKCFVVVNNRPMLNKSITMSPNISCGDLKSLIIEAFNDKLIPTRLFTEENRILDFNQDYNIPIQKLGLKDGDVLYVEMFEEKPNIFDNSLLNSPDIMIIPLDLIEKVLLSFGLKFNSHYVPFRILNGIPDQSETLLGLSVTDVILPDSFSNINIVNNIINYFFPFMDIERINEVIVNYISKPDEEFPRPIDRITPVLIEEPLHGFSNIEKSLTDYKNFLSDLPGTPEKPFNILDCLRSIRLFYFIYTPEIPITRNSVYRICFNIGTSLARKSDWLNNKGIEAAILVSLEEYRLYSIDASLLNSSKFSAEDLNSDNCEIVLGDILPVSLQFDISNFTIPLPTNINSALACFSIRSYLDGGTNKKSTETSLIDILPAYRLSNTLETNLSLLWGSYNLTDIQIPNLNYLKQVTSPVLNIKNLIMFLINYIDNNLVRSNNILEKYPSCSIVISIGITRSIAILSGIDPVIFALELSKTSILQEYRSSKVIRAEVKQIYDILKINNILFSTNEDDLLYSGWIWKFMESNIPNFSNIKSLLADSSIFLLTVNSIHGICPTYSEELIINPSKEARSSEIKDLIKYLSNKILIYKKDETYILPDAALKLKVNELTSLVKSPYTLNVGTFYRLIKKDILYILSEEVEKEVLEAIGSPDVNIYDFSSAPFLISYYVLLNVIQIPKESILEQLIRFIIYEVLSDLDIVVGNLELDRILLLIIEKFSFSDLEISRDIMSKYLMYILPPSSPVFISYEYVDVICDYIISQIESKEPLINTGFRPLSKGIVVDYFPMNPRTEFYKLLHEGNNIENSLSITKSKLISYGYPSVILDLYLSHIRHITYMYNNGIIHTGRLESIPFLTRYQHLASILLSFGYIDFQIPLLTSNIDIDHCPVSINNILNNNLRRVDHIYQICKTICLEIHEISHSECDFFIIQSLATKLLEPSKENKFSSILSILGHLNFIDSNIDLLKNIFIDSLSQRVNSSWINILINEQINPNFSKLYNKIFYAFSKTKYNTEEVTNLSFNFFQILGEFISMWTNPIGDYLIRNILIFQSISLKLEPPLLNIWPGNKSFSGLYAKTNKPTVRIIKQLSESIRNIILSNPEDFIINGSDVNSINNETLNSYIIEMIHNIGLTYNYNIKSLISQETNVKDIVIKHMKDIQKSDYDLYSYLTNLGTLNAEYILHTCIEKLLEMISIADIITLTYSEPVAYCIDMTEKVMIDLSVNIFRFNTHSTLLEKNGQMSPTEIRSMINIAKMIWILEKIISFYIYAYSGITKKTENDILLPYTLLKSTGLFNLITMALQDALMNSGNSKMIDSSNQNIVNIVNSLFNNKKNLQTFSLGFNPWNIKDIFSNILYISGNEFIYRFGSNLGMNSLTFKVFSIYKILLDYLSLNVYSKSVNKDKLKYFIDGINHELYPFDNLIYSLTDFSIETCIVDFSYKYSKETNKFIQLREWNLIIKNICNSISSPIKREMDTIALHFLKEDKILWPQYIVDYQAIDLKREIEKFINSISPNKLVLFYQLLGLFDLKFTPKLQFIKQKVKKTDALPVLRRKLSRWNKQSIREIFRKLKSKQLIIEKLKKPVVNHIQKIIPFLNSAIRTLNTPNSSNYRETRHFFSKMLVVMGNIEIPSYEKKGVNPNLSKEFDLFKSLHEGTSDIVCYGIRITEYIQRILWYLYYWNVLSNEMNIILGELPRQIKKRTNKVERKDNIVKDKSNETESNKIKVNKISIWGKILKGFSLLKDQIKRPIKKK
ncbi:uncharacterized protein CMU_014490 [Cryptosporidium muris RN66]|uniref:Ubiquitin-like domain-containing protein n=1 Tax=Cryptosporidium muris (strain RN66) TaxID=441375 RepID=B6AF06_CRYMR|nr:uncharacterized protein CMU_014490 [Cryptosporidium muris RN66]EEA06773.1 hypothetical protein CMU_014490 [Cryptosporidium muris RN66]|eukprot:XP_002141122.1 hypothetical protein [Cryptosporidium muris RN66]